MTAAIEQGNGSTYALDEDLRILVVDDDPIQREFTSVYVATPTAEVVAVSSAAEGLAKLARSKFDAVLIDFDMPGMDGLEFVKVVRADARWTGMPLIMVTSCDDIETVDAAYLAGANSFITKPVNWRLLAYQIKYVLRDCRAKTAA